MRLSSILWCSRSRGAACDFDAWAYNIEWPHTSLSESSLPLAGFASLTVEDFKFAYNAWCTLRLALYYGAAPPKVLSNLTSTTPTMDISSRGNRLFHMHAEVAPRERQWSERDGAHGPQKYETERRASLLGKHTVKVALTPQHPNAISIHDFTWDMQLLLEKVRDTAGPECERLDSVFTDRRISSSSSSPDTQKSILNALKKTPSKTGFEIVLGMENGLSQEVIDACDYHLFIPQYGSIGSLSMVSAMAIAVHSAHQSMHRQIGSCTSTAALQSRAPGSGKHAQGKTLPSEARGHMPQSHPSPPSSPKPCLVGRDCDDEATPSDSGKKTPRRPHETDLMSLSNESIKMILMERRRHYPIQLALSVYNELGDRNVGALMRNGNAFNCEKMIVINRRKFSRRGALGTQSLLQIEFEDDTHGVVQHGCLEGYAVWALYSDYPYLRNYFNPWSRGLRSDIRASDVLAHGMNTKKRTGKRSLWNDWIPQHTDEVEVAKATHAIGLTEPAFLRSWDTGLKEWMGSNGQVSASHPIFSPGNDPSLSATSSFSHEKLYDAQRSAWLRCEKREVFFDDDESIRDAVHDVIFTEGKRGIALLVPEEGATIHPSCLPLIDRIVHVVHPQRLSTNTQRGLNGALSTSVALCKLRSVCDQMLR